MLTIIPDIHANLDLLERCLDSAAGTRPALLGDFIDAGENPKFTPDDRGVLHRVRPLIDGGEALAVMGNHELNAILFHRRGPDGQPLRAHSDKNFKQHESFIAAIGTETLEALDWTDWFLSALPLWHEGEGFRMIHACWSDPEIEIIRARRPDGRLRLEDLPEIAREDTDFGRAVKLITSGREVPLPEGYSFLDKNSHRRYDVRLSWWRDGGTWRTAALSVPDRNSLPDAPLPADLVTPTYPEDAAPVFVGHYKMDLNPRLENDRVLCLDYPGSPCVYHWQGEARHTAQHIHPLPSRRATAAGDALGSTGYGAFVFKIVFRTAKADAETVQKEIGLVPEYRDDDPGRAYFTWSPTGTKRRDDETIVYSLRNALPDDVEARILWEESRY
jgi:hypothetical protein